MIHRVHQKGRAFQLPEGGFDHPFQDSSDHPMRYQGKEFGPSPDVIREFTRRELDDVPVGTQ